MSIESVMDGVTGMVGNPLTVPIGLSLIAILYLMFGIDVANIVISLITFALLPVLQYSQTKDTTALHVKLDEVIRSSDARNDFIGIDKKPKEEIESKRQDCP